jgi:beta-hydroxylase
MENLAIKVANPFVFKFVPKVSWNGFILTNSPIFKGYGNDIRDGFIHLSTHEQLYSTFTSKYLEQEKCDFKLLAVDINTVDNIKWEKAKNGLVYPHAYSGLLVKRDILWVIDMDNYTFNCDGI